MRHSSAALRWLFCRFCSVSSWCLMVLSSCLMYSVLRSRKAACAWRLRCLRSSEVAYIFAGLVSAKFEMGIEGVAGGDAGMAGSGRAHRFAAALALLLLRLFLGIRLC